MLGVSHSGFQNTRLAWVRLTKLAKDILLLMLEDFKPVDIETQESKCVPTAALVSSGIPIPPVRLIEIFSPDEWEAFTEEWLTFHKTNGVYEAIRRYSGPGDLGLDVVAFTASDFAEPWDSFQCKHYDHALTPGDVCAEVGKIIYHSFKRTPPFNQLCFVPRRHIFVSPRGVGITVGRWFKDPLRFREEICERWNTQCVLKLGAGISAPLEGDLSNYIHAFDFSIFGDKTGAELIGEHSKTVFYAPRFGGGLPQREEVPEPPNEPSDHESLYLRKLYDVYEEHTSHTVASINELEEYPHFVKHYDRQRILFYSAEALRNFARDRTPYGTFEQLQEDIFNGVIDVCEAMHPSGLLRLRSVITTAARIDVSGNALVGVTYVADKQGACHQLANDDRLTWVVEDE